MRVYLVSAILGPDIPAMEMVSGSISFNDGVVASTAL